jgi:hypothetical protein
MNDDQLLLEKLAATDVCPPGSALPEDARSRDVALAEIERRVGMQTRERPQQMVPEHRMSRGLLVAAVAFIAVLVVGTATLFWPTRSGGPDVVDEPTTTVAPATTTTVPATTLPAATPPAESSAPTTTVPSKPASLEISWERVPEQAALEDGWIAAVTPGGPGYVAVGGTVGCSDPLSRNCRRDAAVWVSADGLAWERVDSPSFRGEVTREVADGDPLDGNQYMNDIALGPGGLVAVGAAPLVDLDQAAGSLDRPGIWISPDGRQWERLPHDEDLFGGVVELSRIVAFGDLLVAVAEPKAFVSLDGTDWEQVNVDPSSTGAVLDLAVWNETLVAVGYSQVDPDVDPRPAVWISDDGFDWTMVEDPDLMSAFGQLQGVGGNAAGLVALGTDSGWVTAWRSEDGNDWTVAYEPLDDREWDLTARTVLSVGTGTGGIEDDLILINGMVKLWGTADGGRQWYSVGEFNGGAVEVLAGPSPAVFNTVNQALVDGDQLLVFGKVVTYSGTEPIGGACYTETPGWCRADAAIWVGTWENP